MNAPRTFVVLLDGRDLPDHDGLSTLIDVVGRARAADNDPTPWPREKHHDANDLRRRLLATFPDRSAGLVVGHVRQTGDVVVFARVERFAWVRGLIATVRAYAATHALPPLTFQPGVVDATAPEAAR